MKVQLLHSSGTQQGRTDQEIAATMDIVAFRAQLTSDLLGFMSVRDPILFLFTLVGGGKWQYLQARKRNRDEITQCMLTVSH